MTQIPTKSRLLYMLFSMNQCPAQITSHQMPISFMTSSLPSLDITSSPFTSFVMIDMPYGPFRHSPFWFCSVYMISTLSCLCLLIHLTARRMYPLHYVLHTFRIIGHLNFDQPVFSPSDLAPIHTFIQSQQTTLTIILIVLAPECCSSFGNFPTPTQLHVHDLCHISALQSLTREGTTVDLNQAISDYLDILSTSQMEFIVNRLQSSTMTDEEWVLPKLTCWQLRNLPNWPLWDAACNKQLVVHFIAGVFLTPILHPEHLPGVHPNILQIHWTFAVKDDATCKAWATMDGSKHAAPWLHEAIKTYASCIDQSLMKLCIGGSTQQNCHNCWHNECIPTVPTTN